MLAFLWVFTTHWSLETLELVSYNHWAQIDAVDVQKRQRNYWILQPLLMCQAQHLSVKLHCCHINAVKHQIPWSFSFRSYVQSFHWGDKSASCLTWVPARRSVCAGRSSAQTCWRGSRREGLSGWSETPQREPGEFLPLGPETSRWHHLPAIKITDGGQAEIVLHS